MNTCHNSQSEIEARELRQVAMHEAGHVIVAKHFGAVIINAYLWRNEGDPDDEKAWLGRVQCVLTDDTPFRRACFGWAGVIAEEFTCDDDESPPQSPDDMWCMLCDEVDLMSDTDRACVEATPMRWRAFKTAFGIVFNNLDAVRAEAYRLSSNLPTGAG